MTWNGNMFIATGQGTNTLAYSSNGTVWVGLGTTVFSTSGRNVAWNGIRYVAVGAGTNTIAHSLNGITWTVLGNSIFSTSGYGIYWNGSKFIASGDGSTNFIASSSDGINWTGLGTTIYGINNVTYGFDDNSNLGLDSSSNARNLTTFNTLTFLPDDFISGLITTNWVAVGQITDCP